VLALATAFAVIGFPVVAGYLLDQFGRLHADSHAVLHKVAYWICNPALVFAVLATTPIEQVVSPFTLAFALATAAAAVAYAAHAAIARRDVADTVIGSAASVYVNSTIIGVPVATYVLGTAEHVGPVMLLSMLVIAPVTLLAMGVAGERRKGTVRSIVFALGSPLILSAIAGAAVSWLAVPIPEMVFVPLQGVGSAAIPIVLIAFGMSLRHQRMFVSHQRLDTLVAVMIKSLVMPAAGWAAASWLGLEPDLVYEVVIMAALPTAQNLLNYAVTFGRGEVIARDTMLLTTALFAPILAAIAFAHELLG